MRGGSHFCQSPKGGGSGVFFIKCKGGPTLFFRKKIPKFPPRKNVPFLNRIRKMVSSEPGKEIEKVVISSCHERGTKKTF